MAYLSGHRQCVRVGSCVSDLLPVTLGVPQGSILGPLLFILYINDLPTVPINSSLPLFADDGKCYRRILSIEDSQLLQSDLRRLCEWSHSSGLIFNSSKSCVLSYHSPRSDPITFDYSIDYQVIDHLSVCKDLGVLFSDSLSWSSQVELALKKAYATLRMVKRVFPGATTPPCVKRKLYLSLVVPMLPTAHLSGGPP